MNVHIDNFIGTRLAEYEVFVQYYSELVTGSQRSRTYQLHSYIRHVMDRHHWILEYFKFVRHKDSSHIELLLAVIAMELYSGATSSFYEMLNFMQHSEEPFQHLGTEIQESVEIFDLHKSSGMLASITHIDYQSHMLAIECVMYCV